MGQYYKTREFKVDDNVLNYFYLNTLKYYDEIYIINDNDFKKIFDNKDIVMFDNINGNNIVSDNNPIYLNLKILNNANIIYLKEKLELLDNEVIKNFINNFRGTIICNKDLISYLLDLALINEEIVLKDKTYLKIDKYGIIKEINI